MPSRARTQSARRVALFEERTLPRLDPALQAAYASASARTRRVMMRWFDAGHVAGVMRVIDDYERTGRRPYGA